MTTLVLLHAFPVDSRLWAAQAAALRAEGHTVVTPELPGFGGSPTPTQEPHLRVAAEEVLGCYEGAAVVAGLSMGGYVLMEMLRIAPERVSGAVFVDTKAGADSPEARANRFAVAEQVLAAGSTTALADAMIPALLGPTTVARRPDVVAAVRHMIEATSPEAVAWAQGAMAERPDSHADLTGYRGPAAIIWGEEDAISPWSDQEAMARSLPDVTVVTVPGVGHLSAVEDPAPVTAALRQMLLRATGG